MPYENGNFQFFRFSVFSSETDPFSVQLFDTPLTFPTDYVSHQALLTHRQLIYPYHPNSGPKAFDGILDECNLLRFVSPDFCEDGDGFSPRWKNKERIKGELCKLRQASF